MVQPNTPVLIGGGQILDKVPAEDGKTPIELMAETLRFAAIDAVGEKSADALLKQADVLAAVGMVVDAPGAHSAMKGKFANPPKSVANRLNISCDRYVYTGTGGNTPQQLVNAFCEEIAKGKAEVVLLTGAEALGTMVGRFKQALPMDAWEEDPGGEYEFIGSPRGGNSQVELDYGLEQPVKIYPMFENALRVKYGRTHEEHMKKVGEIFAGFTKVAANNPFSWFPVERTAEELVTLTDQNRYVGFPYPKFLNSIIQVNQGASVILTSYAKAVELGIDADRMVFLHGCGDAYDIWNVTERRDFSSSPAVNVIARRAFEMAGKTVDDMEYFDIYSCFPSAVQIACDEIGLAHDDPRGLTLTGGLPYFGGPGNNYVMHSIVEMLNRLRDKPGAFGLLNANGWYITKHSLGIYSTTPVEGEWARENPETYAQEPTDVETPPFVEVPEEKEGRIETYTVLHSRKGLEKCVIVGITPSGKRFLAETPADEAVLLDMMNTDSMERTGRIEQTDGRNIFIPN